MPTTTPVQTSAHAPEPDLFGMDPASGPDMTAYLLVLTGRVIADAKVAIQGVGADHMPAAVVTFDLLYEPGGHTVHVEQIFPLTRRSAAEGLVARLRRGVVVQVTHPAAGTHLVLPHAISIAPVAAH